MPAALIGTSGYDYPAWKGRFYPPKLKASQRLVYYASRFPTVEINYTFYRLPDVGTLEEWAAATPPSFRFSVKASQTITHHKRLNETGEIVGVFATLVRALGPKLAPVLYQLPPNFKKDLPRLQAFLQTLPKDLKAAFEFRHASWFEDDVFEALRAAGVALCIAEADELATPQVRTAKFAYLRLRKTKYSGRELDAWAERVREQQLRGDVYVYFKHEDTAAGTRYADKLTKAVAKLSG